MNDAQKAVGLFSAKMIDHIRKSREASFSTERILEELIMELAGQYGAYLQIVITESVEPSVDTRNVGIA